MSFDIPSINPSGEVDDKAKDETDAFSENENLEAEATRNKHNRKQRILHHVSFAMVIVFWVAVLLALGAIVSWAWHFLTPEHKHYLTPEQINKIETVIFTGATASLVQAYAKKHL